MEHAQFWAIIDEANGSNPALVRSLSALPRARIVEFAAWFRAYHRALGREDLWCAVFAIRGGCGDDRFDYFRAWLVGRGEEAVLAAIHDPEALADIIGDDDPDGELLLGSARRAYGDNLPALPALAIPGRETWPADRIATGQKWDAAFYAKQFPRLYERYFKDLPPTPPGDITLERFWAIVDEGLAGAASATAALVKLERVLAGLATTELIGFDRWWRAYNQALMRTDLRWAARITLGRDDTDAIAGFRGWVLVQGRDVVHIATHDLDAILEAARVPLVRCVPAIHVTQKALDVSYDDEPCDIPDRATWTPDLDKPTVADLRARFPRLTAGISDDRLGGPYDLAKLADDERARLATERWERAQQLYNAAARLPVLDEVLVLAPDHVDARAIRGRTHVELGQLDAALADFDAVLAKRPDFARSHWERSKIRLARGDKAGAIADARAAAHLIDEARAWLATQTTSPKRVRHAKFGEGNVVSIDTTGSEPKLVIDFASGRKTIGQRFVEVLD